VSLLGQGGQAPVLPAASAQVADAGTQRTAMVEEQRRTNDKLDKLIDLLKGGDVQVKVLNAEESKDGAAPAKRK
jgi:hypothetical protein